MIGRRGLVLQLDAQLVHAPLVDQSAQRLNGLDADLALRARHERQQRVHELRIADLAEGAHHDRQRLGVARLQHLLQPRQSALAANLRQGVNGALAHPPVRIARRADELVDGALILRLVQDLDRGTPDVVILVAYELNHGFDDLRSADLAERVCGSAADPPVAVLDGGQEVLDGNGGSDLVQHFHRRAARILILVLQNINEIAHRIGVIRLDDKVDRLVLHVDFRIAQQSTHALDVDRALGALQGREHGAAYELVRITQQGLQGRLHFARVEARKDVDDMDARDRILAV